MLEVKGDSQYKTIQDLIAYIKANPGKVKIGGTGALSFHEVELNVWKNMDGLDFTYVPYEKGYSDFNSLYRRFFRTS